MSETSELYYLNGQDMIDVMFIVERQRLPALKSVLSDKSQVFSAMFSGNFKESKDNEIVIEDTTYMAFKAFLQFLYCDDLVLDIDNDLKLIGELYRLSDRYSVPRLESRILDEFHKRYFSSGKCVSDQVFQEKWLTIRSIERLAIEWQFIRLIEEVMTFIDTNLEYFLKKDIEELYELNDWFEGRLFELILNKCRKLSLMEPQWTLIPSRKLGRGKPSLKRD